MKTIPLTQGRVALVDDEDFEFLSQWKWCACRRGRLWYAGRNLPKKNGKTTGLELMHRRVAERHGIVGDRIDHRDHDGLNNQKLNLRGATVSQNAANSKLNANSTSGYTGVSRFNKRWSAYIKLEGKKIHLGYYGTPIEAARAYNAAAVECFGEFANLNTV